MELASAAQIMGVQICGAIGCLVTERVVPNTQRIDPHRIKWFLSLKSPEPVSRIKPSGIEGEEKEEAGVIRCGIACLLNLIPQFSMQLAKQKTPAPDSARVFCNARRSQVNESSLTRNEI